MSLPWVRGKKNCFKFDSCQASLFTGMHMCLNCKGERQSPYLFTVQTRVHSGKWTFSPHLSICSVEGPTAWLENYLNPSFVGSILLVEINGVTLLGAALWQQIWNPRRYTFADIFTADVWISFSGSRWIPLNPILYPDLIMPMTLLPLFLFLWFHNQDEQIVCRKD